MLAIPLYNTTHIGQDKGQTQRMSENKRPLSASVCSIVGEYDEITSSPCPIRPGSQLDNRGVLANDSNASTESGYCGEVLDYKKPGQLSTQVSHRSTPEANSSQQMVQSALSI
jgi:hypothetical protein